MDYQRLTATFPGRRLTRIVNITKASPLRYAEIVVYSCLVQRAAYTKGARQKQVSLATGLHESTAVPKALGSLQRHGLVEKRGVYWWAVEPPAAVMPWFRLCLGSEGRKWSSRFSYWWTGTRRPKTPITAIQTSLYFKLLNLQGYGRRITMRGVARLLGVDVKTVTQGVKKLKSLKLVDDDLHAITPQPGQMKWFRQRREKPPFVVSEFFGCFEQEDRDEAVLSRPLVDKGGRLLLEAGFSEKQAVSYYSLVLRECKWWPVVYAFVTRFEQFFKDIQRQHRENVAAGKYMKARNCRGLLEVETRKRIAALRHGKDLF